MVSWLDCGVLYPFIGWVDPRVYIGLLFWTRYNLPMTHKVSFPELSAIYSEPSIVWTDRSFTNLGWKVVYVFLLFAARVRSSCEEGPGRSALQSAYHDPKLDVKVLKQNRIRWYAHANFDGLSRVFEKFAATSANRWLFIRWTTFLYYRIPRGWSRSVLQPFSSCFGTSAGQWAVSGRRVQRIRWKS